MHDVGRRGHLEVLKSDHLVDFTLNFLFSIERLCNSHNEKSLFPLHGLGIILTDANLDRYEIRHPDLKQAVR